MLQNPLPTIAVTESWLPELGWLVRALRKAMFVAEMTGTCAVAPGFQTCRSGAGRVITSHFLSTRTQEIVEIDTVLHSKKPNQTPLSTFSQLHGPWTNC